MKDSGSTRHSPLLSDLEDLKKSLTDDTDRLQHIPVLDDILEPSPTFQADPAAPSLADSGVRYSDTPADAEETAREHHYPGDDDHSREVFIQALIDDLLPDIEAELRRRLLKLDSEILARWHQQSRG